MQILERIVSIIKNNRGEASGEFIFSALADCKENYSDEEIKLAFEILQEKLLAGGAYASIVKKGDVFRFTSDGKERLLDFIKRPKPRLRYDNIAQFLEASRDRLRQKELAGNDESVKTELKEIILTILKENESLELSELISKIAAIKNKKHGDGYLLFARSFISQLVALGVIAKNGTYYEIGKNDNANFGELKEPKSNNELKELIKSGAELSKIYVGDVSDFSGIFEGFKGDISGALSWDTWHVEDMSEIFKGADLKGISLSSWAVNNVKSLKSAFENASGICGIEGWETDSLENIDSAFKNCVDFELDLREWRTEQINSLNNAFENCAKFDGASLNDWSLALNFSANNAFKGAKNHADWCDDDKNIREFYIYKIDSLESDFKLANTNEIKARLSTDISWLRDEISSEFKFYFKDLGDKRKPWECVIELFDMKFLFTPKKDLKLKKDEFKIRLQKLDLDDETINEEAFVNPFIKIIESGQNYSTGQNNDDIYFGYKGIFVDSTRFSLLTRTAILYILARAYKEKFEDFIKTSSNPNADLSLINAQASKFNLEKYFRVPVIASDGAMQAGIWKKIFDLYELDETYEQITAKISTMANILDAIERDKQEEREKKRERLITIASTIIGILVGVLPMAVDWMK